MQLPITVKPCRKFRCVGICNSEWGECIAKQQWRAGRYRGKGTEGNGNRKRCREYGNTEETEPEPEVKEAPNPMISYVLIGGLALIVIGAAYYFKVVRKKKRTLSRTKMKMRKITRSMKTKMRNRRKISLTNRRNKVCSWWLQRSPA